MAEGLRERAGTVVAQSGGTDSPAAMVQPRLVALFSAFFRVGLTSFGMAILQSLRTTTLRRGFVSAAEIE